MQFAIELASIVFMIRLANLYFEHLGLRTDRAGLIVLTVAISLFLWFHSPPLDRAVPIQPILPTPIEERG